MIEIILIAGACGFCFLWGRVIGYHEGLKKAAQIMGIDLQ